MSLEGIAVINIPSMHGGSNLWGETRKPLGEARNASCQNLPEAITDPEALKSCVQGETEGLNCAQDIVLIRG